MLLICCRIEQMKTQTEETRKVIIIKILFALVIVLNIKFIKCSQYYLTLHRK